jgi:SAM-dependent methyltransferase
VPFLCRTDNSGCSPFELTATAESGGHVIDGYLRRGDEWYPIMDGVPWFLSGALRPDLTAFAARHSLPVQQESGAASSGQSATSETFSFKWSTFQDYGDDPKEKDFLFAWYRRKFGLEQDEDLASFYRDRDFVLEVGSGSGFNTRFAAEHCRGKVFAADLSAAADTTFGKTRHLRNCAVIRADLMDLPFRDALFDLVIADGVLHHTPSTEAAMRALYLKVKPGGQLFFYVYKKMGPARQFCDEYIRSAFGRLSPGACLEACRALTEMGRELSRLDARITLTKPVELLGIPAGTHDVQRLLYYNFVKCFWNDAFDFETNNMINFDWYHPHHAWQHTEQEVEGWLVGLGVRDYKFNDANPNGISVLLTKPCS